MRPRFCLHALLAALCVVAPLAAQDLTSREASQEIPFAQWIAKGKRTELPVSISISSPRFSVLQRHAVEFKVKISSLTLSRLGPTYQLFLDVRLKPAKAADWLEEHDVVVSRLVQRLPTDHDLEFSMQALVLPGRYTVGFVLFERISGRRSVALRTLKVSPLVDDPLPEISRNLPPVEFFQRGVDEDREAIPVLPSRLWLPVATRRPVRIELLVNFSAPEPVPGTPGRPNRNTTGLGSLHQRNLSRMLGIMKVFSQMDLSNGSLHITALDIVRRKVFFELDAGSEFDWLRLRAALEEINPASIPVQALESRRQDAAFFRELLLRRLLPAAPVTAHTGESGNEGDGGSNGSPAAPEPLRVLIVVSTPLVFERGSDLAPAAPAHGADYRAYHLQYRLSPAYVWDDLPRVLRGLGPRRFDVQSAEEFHRALARLLADLRAL